MAGIVEFAVTSTEPSVKAIELSIPENWEEPFNENRDEVSKAIMDMISRPVLVFVSLDNTEEKDNN